MAVTGHGTGEQHHPSAGLNASYTLRCHACQTLNPVPGASEAFDCTCGRHHSFLHCQRCSGVNIISGTSQHEPTGWFCEWCLVHNTNFGLRRRTRRTSTAAEAFDVLDRHGLIDCGPGVRVLGGFRLIGGYGDTPPLQTLCSISTLADALLVVAEVGATGSLRLPYTDLHAIEVSGRGLIVPEPDRSHVTGTISGLGAFSGHIGPGLLDTLKRFDMSSRTPKIDSLLRITTASTELHLRHWAIAPEDVRDILSRAFVAHRTAERQRTTPAPNPAPAPATTPAPSSPLGELERLTKLHAAGTLTDTEFERARAKQIQRLHNTSG